MGGACVVSYLAQYFMFCFCHVLGTFPTFGIDAGAYTHYFLGDVIMISPFALYEEYDLTGCVFNVPFEV